MPLQVLMLSGRLWLPPKLNLLLTRGGGTLGAPPLQHRHLLLAVCEERGGSVAAFCMAVRVRAAGEAAWLGLHFRPGRG